MLKYIKNLFAEKPVKFCVDCKWCDIDFSYKWNSRCRHKKAINKQIIFEVTGVDEGEYCSDMRAYLECGKKAKLFEAR